MQEQGIRRATDKSRYVVSNMIIPVRCFTCGKLIGDKWEEFARRVREGESPREVLDSMNIYRYCCRRMLLSHVEIIDEIIKFYDVKKGESR